MKIKNYHSPNIDIPEFEALPGQYWCILGSNRSGIEAFFRLLSGQTLPGPDQVIPESSDLGVLSFAGQQALFEEELKKDDTDFMDRIDPGTPAGKFLNAPEHHMEIIHAFGMEKTLDLGFRQLSTGQSRKILLLAQITQGKKWLVIQAPYEGLDTQSCLELDKVLDICRSKKMGIITIIHDPCDIPDQATHIAVVDRGRMVLAGERQKILHRIPDIPGRADFRARADELSKGEGEKENAELIRLEQGGAGYQGRPVFSSLDLSIRTGEHTLVSGPNGCGKSTLLQVITGDHPDCYQNQLWVFGTRRGTGESIWDLKKRMGIVSPDLHRNYIVPGSVLDCVLSGLYDSIGLYTAPTPEDKKAVAWLERINLAPKGPAPFRSLSFADQRLVLIARALIKMPDLLILDEPTQGLDRANRKAVLDFLEEVARENLSTILYVSHREDEFRSFFVSRLKMGGKS